MARDSLRGFLQLGFFIVVAGICSLLAAQPGSGEFIISICVTIMGLMLIGGSVLVWRLLQ
ncbi:MAG: hypothetical protein ACOCX5_01410 [Chloroflexota bacterium]